jgi:hypothetical protein
MTALIALIRDGAFQAYAARRLVLSRALEFPRRPDARLPRFELVPVAEVRRPRERDELLREVRLRDELPELRVRRPDAPRLDVPEAERRLEPLLDLDVRVELRPRVERLVERAVRPSERLLRLSSISFLSSAVSRLTSLLKLLFCPRAVFS